MSIGPREHKDTGTLFLGNSVQTKRRQLFGRRRRQHQRQHDARRARQQAGRAIKARPQPGERRVESLILELPVPATEGQRHCCRVAGAFDEAEERLEPGSEIVHVVIEKASQAGRVFAGNGARSARRRRPSCSPGPGLCCRRGSWRRSRRCRRGCALRRYQRRERRRRAPFTGRQLLTRTLVDDGHDRMFQAAPWAAPAGPARVRRWSRWFHGVADAQRVDMRYTTSGAIGLETLTTQRPHRCTLHYARLPRNTTAATRFEMRAVDA